MPISVTPQHDTSSSQTAPQGADAPDQAPAGIPLCTDLDGTLLLGDSLYELLFACLRRRPLLVFIIPFWLLGGKAALKRRLAAAEDPARLAFLFNEPFLAFLRGQHGLGRRLVLATAADRAVAEAVAARLGIFDEVLATRDGRNLRGEAKAAALVARFGARGFDYAGNDAHDLPVWAQARAAIVVAPRGARIRDRAAAVARVEHAFDAPRPAPKALLRALRPHQWAKNALVFLPVIAAHRIAEPLVLGEALLAFVAMCLAASAGYVANDLLDLQADRAHPRKRRRPFASGSLPVPLGPPLAAVLLLPALVVAAAVGVWLLAWVLLYLALTLAYSMWLKRKVLIDVFVLAGLYTHRILAGAIATGIAPSFWLLALSMFFFLSLAMLKRYSELVRAMPDAGSGTDGQPGLRGYRAEDLDTLGSLGAASGFSAVFVLALYIESENVRALYRTPEIFWLCCPLLLYWISRMWVGARRGKIDDDPLVFALRERVSLGVLALLAGLAVLSATVDVRCLIRGACP